MDNTENTFITTHTYTYTKTDSPLTHNLNTFHICDANRNTHIYDFFVVFNRWWWLSLFIFTSISSNSIVNVCTKPMYKYMMEFSVQMNKVVSPFESIYICDIYVSNIYTKKDYVAHKEIKIKTSSIPNSSSRRAMTVQNMTTTTHILANFVSFVHFVFICVTYMHDDNVWKTHMEFIVKKEKKTNTSKRSYVNEYQIHTNMIVRRSDIIKRCRV